MTSEQRIDQLMKTPPKVKVSMWHRIERVIGWVSLVIAIASFIGVCFLAVDAADGTACTNTQLGARSGLLISLIDDQNTYAAGQSSALHELTQATTPKAAEAALADYQSATDKFTAASTTLASYAKNHPLGKC